MNSISQVFLYTYASIYVRDGIPSSGIAGRPPIVLYPD